MTMLMGKKRCKECNNITHIHKGPDKDVYNLVIASFTVVTIILILKLVKLHQ